MDTYGIRRQAMDTKGTKYPVSVYQKYQVSGIRIPQVPSILRTGKVYGYLAVFEGRDRGFPGFFQGYLGLSRVIPARVIQGYPVLYRVI